MTVLLSGSGDGPRCSDVGLEASQGYQPSSLEASGGGPAESPRRGATAGSAADRLSQAMPRQPERAAGAAALYIGHSRDGAVLQKGLVGLRRALLGWYPVGSSVIGRHRGGGWTGPGWLLVPADDHRIKARQQGGDRPVEFLQVVDPRWTGWGTGLIASTIPCRRRLSACLGLVRGLLEGARHGAGFRATWQPRSVMSSRVGRCSTAPPHPPWTWGWGSDSRNSIRRHR
jgi:hypothetical protein